MLEHPRCYLRLVGGKAEDDDRRSMLTECKRACELGPHQRRGIIEQHDQCTLCRCAVIGAQVGIEVSSRQGGGCVAALSGCSRAHPLQELTSDHAASKATMNLFSLLAFLPALRF
jgi:hypothetical protein